MKFKLININELKNKYFLISFLSSILLPIAFILYYYNQNALISEVGYIYFWRVSVILLIFTAFIWVISYIIVRSYLVSQIVTIITSLYLFMVGGKLLKLFGSQINNTKAVVFIIGISYLILVFIVSIFLKKVKSQYITVFLSIMLMLVFAMNMVQGIIIYSKLHYIQSDINIKKDFQTDSSTKPNIYWIHCDGMLGFESFNKYYGDSQDVFTNELNERGFNISRKATFECGHATSIGIPALMCPYFYDNVLYKKLDSNKAAMEYYKSFRGNNETFEARKNNELLNAFESAGYTSYIIGTSRYYLPVSNISYTSATAHSNRLLEDVTPINDRINDITIDFLYNFLNKAMPLPSIIVGSKYPILLPRPILKGNQNIEFSLQESTLKQVLLGDGGIEYYRWMIEGLYDCLQRQQSSSTPTLTIVADSMAHYPFIMDENGNKVHDDDNLDPLTYYEQHIYATKVLINMIDMILQYDPNAVIICQGDHGLHGNTQEDFVKAFGKNADNLELWNNVISAVRIPEKYAVDDLEVINNPLNISRYLVNNYVGKNYSYLK